MTRTSSLVAKRWLAPLTLVIVGLVVVLVGGAGTAPAASPVVTITKSSFPDAGVPVAYSSVIAGQSTYISYTINVNYAGSNGTLTHSRLSDPVSCNSAGCTDLQYAGAEVVYVSDTCGTAVYRGTTSFPKQGVACDLGSLIPGTNFDVQIIFKVPTQAAAGGATTFSNVAGFTAKEGPKDNTPTSSHTDTFASNGNVPVVTPLTPDALDALNSYAPPGVVTKLQTDSKHVTGNFQTSQVTLTGPPKGSLVQLRECGGLGTACPTGTGSPCPVATPCKTQTSLVFVTGSGGAFFQSNHMTLVFTLFASELSSRPHDDDHPGGTSTVKWYHDGRLVGLCPDRTSDPSGDCLVGPPVRNSVTGDVTITVDGPAQGGWGGIG